MSCLQVQMLRLFPGLAYKPEQQLLWEEELADVPSSSELEFDPFDGEKVQVR